MRARTGRSTNNLTGNAPGGSRHSAIIGEQRAIRSVPLWLTCRLVAIVHSKVIIVSRSKSVILIVFGVLQMRGDR